jgi:hypothetical protein
LRLVERIVDPAAVEKRVDEPAARFRLVLPEAGRVPEAVEYDLVAVRQRRGAIATTWLYITEDGDCAERMLTDVLTPMVNRPVEALRSLSLPIGPAEMCPERLTAFANAGAQRLFLWPLRDEVTQLELFLERVAPAVIERSRTTSPR